MSKHTPGPWKIESGGEYQKRILADGRFTNSLQIATTYATMKDEEFEANAHLIAAAPELLKVCKEMLDRLAFGGVQKEEVYADLLTLARNTIAKAEGREP